MRGVRFSPLACVVLTLATGCGSTTSGLQISVPGYPIRFALPHGWAWITYRDSQSRINAFVHKYPIEASEVIYLSAAETENAADKLIAVSPNARSDFKLDVTRVKPSLTLQRDIRLQSAGFSQQGATVHGPANELVAIAGDRAWRLWWSASDGTHTLNVVQYEFIRGDRKYLFTYRTLGPTKAISTLFDPSAHSIRFVDKHP
jgi:hypothetical protein